ncbi:MAG: hypothetical protein CME38_09815 [Haliea sp.]|nr:hypothetical protein [Haliea sp.]|tara:strand:+ start:58 stop:267 length:210 start_codon:yes stop_codon:yes gene_type:complete
MLDIVCLICAHRFLHAALGFESRRQHRLFLLRRLEESDRALAPDHDPLNDGFYCLFLSSGRTISGYIKE